MSSNSFRLPETRMIPPGPRWTEIEPPIDDINKKYVEILRKVINGRCRLITTSDHVILNSLVEKLEQDIIEKQPPRPPAM